MDRRQLLVSVAATALLLCESASARNSFGGGSANVSTPGKVVWNQVGVNGGGLITGIDIANDGTKVCRTDVGGAYIFDATASKWVQLMTQLRMPVAAFAGNPGYRQFQGTSEIKIAPLNSNIIWLLWGGYLYKSVDRGLNFSQTNYPQNQTGASTDYFSPNNGTYRTMQHKIAIDPANSNIVYASYPTGQPKVTFDGGVTWGDVPNLPVGTTIGAIGWAFDASSGTSGGKTKTIYVMVEGSGTWQSTDAGVSFARISTDVGLAFDGNAGSSISSDGVYYAVDLHSAVTRLSRWQSGAWTTIQTNASGIKSATHPTAPGVLCTFVQFSCDFYYSSNYGTTQTHYTKGQQTLTAPDCPWQSAQWNAGFGISAPSAKFDPSNPDVLWMSTGQGLGRSTVSAGIAPSWVDLNAGIQEAVTSFVGHETGSRLLNVTWDFLGFAQPTNALQVSPSNTIQGPLTSIITAYDGAIDPQNPLNMVIAANGTNPGPGYSRDGGVTWTAFATIPATHQNAYSSIAINNGVIIWMPTWSNLAAYPQRSTDWGATWTPINNIANIPSGSDTGWGVSYFVARKTIIADYVDPSTFYMTNYLGTGSPHVNGVYRSIDAGVNWTFISGAGVPYNGLFCVTTKAVPANQGHLFTTCGFNQNATHPWSATPFYRSRDGGATWTAITNVLEVNAFGFGKAYPGASYPTLYIAGCVGNTYGIWMSKDEGDSWTQLYSDAYGPWPLTNDIVTSMDGDKDIVGRVYVGFFGTGVGYCDAA